MTLKTYAVGTAIALAALSSAHAQNFEELLRGLITDAARAAIQPPARPAHEPPAQPTRLEQPVGPLNATQAHQALVDLGYALQRDARARTVQAPIAGFWMHGNPAQADLAPMLISHDGKYVVQITGRNSTMLERLPGGRTRSLTPNESQDLLMSMLANIRPDAMIALGGAGATAPIIITAPNCPACVELDRMMRPMRDLKARVMPTLFRRDAALVYSRIMCQPAPQAAFSATINARGRTYPANVQNCDLRMDHTVLVELLWIATESNRRFVPALFSADGRIMDLDRTSASTVRASIEGAAIER